MSVRAYIDHLAEEFRFSESVLTVLAWNLVATVAGVGALYVGLEYASDGLLWIVGGAVLILSGVTGLGNFARRELL